VSIARSPRGLTRHSLFQLQPDDHHAEVEHQRVICNGLSISPGDYEYRFSWTRDNHITTSACLLGPTTLIPGGRQGAWGSGSQTPTASGAQFISGSGTYMYIASFMRLHGDSYLSTSIFGSSIRWKDIYLDGDETVLVFTNLSVASQLLKFWGMLWAK